MKLKSQFTNSAMKVLLRSHIEQDLGRLDQRVRNFLRQLSDLMHMKYLAKTDSRHFPPFAQLRIQPSATPYQMDKSTEITSPSSLQLATGSSFTT